VEITKFRAASLGLAAARGFEGKSLHIVNGNVVMILKNSRYTTPDGQEKPLIQGKIQIQSEAAEVFYKDIRIQGLNEMPKIYKKLFID